MKPGFVEGRHYTEWVDTVKVMKREGRLRDAEALLLNLVDATEVEAQQLGWGVAPWYYEQVAVIRRKLGDLEGEVAILQRYASQKHAPGATPSKLRARLSAAQDRLRKQGEGN